MRNDVSFPPNPNDPGETPAAAKPAVSTYLNGRSPEPSRPHAADRAHSLEKARDKPATGPIYETPEDRGGIDSTVLSIVVVSIVAIVLLIIGWTVFSGVEATTRPAENATVPNATIIDDPVNKAE